MKLILTSYNLFYKILSTFSIFLFLYQTFLNGRHFFKRLKFICDSVYRWRMGITSGDKYNFHRGGNNAIYNQRVIELLFMHVLHIEKWHCVEKFTNIWVDLNSVSFGKWNFQNGGNSLLSYLFRSLSSSLQQGMNACRTQKYECTPSPIRNKIKKNILINSPLPQ